MMVSLRWLSKGNGGFDTDQNCGIIDRVRQRGVADRLGAVMSDVKSSSVSVNLNYIRSLVSWKPFVSKDNNILGNVSFQVGNTTDLDETRLISCVTDRFRIVSRSDDMLSGKFFIDYEGMTGDEQYLVSMDLLVKFVALFKTVKINYGVRIVWYEDSVNIISSDNTILSERRNNSKYPNLLELITKREPAVANVMGKVGFNVNQVGDFGKIINPTNGKKYAENWTFEQSASKIPGKSGPYVLTNPDDANIIGLIQPTIVR